MRFSQAAVSLPPSGIRELMELAWAAGDVIHLEVGEPSFPTPPHVVEAADRAARDGWTRYTQSAGVPALREAIAAKVSRRNGYQVEPDQVVVTAGGIEAIYLAMLGVLEPGDEVLLPDPGWPNFRMMARLVQAVERLYPLRPELGFLPAAEDLEGAVGPRTRAIVLNSPSNPLGTIVGADRLGALLDLAATHDLWVISDECYDAITFDGTFASPAAVGHPDRVISCYSFSKTYAMTGWRVGYLVVPAGTPAPLGRLQQALLSCVNAPAQLAALAALTGPQDQVTRMRDAYRERRDLLVALLERLGVPCHRPAGAFYAWVDVAGRAAGARQFALELLRQQRVAVAPGTAFGPAGEGWVRLSLATDTDALLEGARRLAGFAVT
ncbi:MAG TPA: pyridoxal phosphate-dependent aminotransferase [Actinomycetota bacterium]|jgi:aspartate/methionine/tyrosine aminotransferase|nr:pyridoxal phosphate-dependent aminotransferase [Actinomycetota bacterium]